MTRRAALRGIATAAASALSMRVVSGTARADVAGQKTRPRYWIVIVPAGGIDAISTTDPRVARELKPGVDVPYAPNQIVRSKGLRLGPHFKSLAPHADRLSVLNGVLVKSANHYTGIERIARMRSRSTEHSAGVLDVLGAHRDSQAIAHAILGAPLLQARTASYIGSGSKAFGAGQNVFQLIDQLEPQRLRELAQAAAKQARAVGGKGLSARRKKELDSMSQAQALFSRAADIPKFSAQHWLKEIPGSASLNQPGATGWLLQRALWLIENDLSVGITLFLGNFGWDTHFFNEPIQSGRNKSLSATLNVFFRELSKRSNRYGRLSDNTVVTVSSEIGRFPYLNKAKGKDHFPQIPMIFSGKAFRTGNFGQTGKELEALPVSFESGKRARSGQMIELDDVGHTFLRVAGIRPSLYGVAGQNLSFIRSA